MSRSVQNNPRINLPIIAAQTSVGTSSQRVLFVGQQTSVATATSGALVASIQNTGAEDALFGENSMVATAVREFRAINQVVNIDVIPLDDNGATFAVGDVTFTGTATAAGTIDIFIGSRINHKFSVPVAVGDTATVIGAALDALIGADAVVPVGSAAVTGVVTLTAIHSGTEGNTIGLAKLGTVAGVTTVLTGLTGGSTNPVLTGVFDVVGDTRYQTVVWPASYGTAEIKAFLDPRFNVDNKVQDGVAILHSFDTFANLQTAGLAENSQSLVILGNRDVTGGDVEGGGLLEISTVIAAQFAAIRSLRLEEGTNIGNFVIATFGQRDTIGGPALASFPYHNTPFARLPLVTQGDGFTDAELQDLLAAGISNIGTNNSGTGAIAGQIKTTYKTDAAANPDPSFGNLEFVDTISTIREIYFSRLRKQYAQTRLTDGEVAGGRAMANVEIIRAFVIGIYQELSSSDFVLTQAGETANQFFRTNLFVELDLVTGAVIINMRVPIVTQLREIQGSIQIVFSTQE